jgi:hypothetical protein
MTVDLILRSGRFTTLDCSNPTATAVAITDGRFTAVGRDEDVMPMAGASTRIIDLKGRRVLPGLIDNHLHIIRGGLNFNMELRWDGVRSLADAMSMLKQQVAITPNRDNFFPEFPRLMPQRPRIHGETTPRRRKFRWFGATGISGVECRIRAPGHVPCALYQRSRVKVGIQIRYQCKARPERKGHEHDQNRGRG